MGGGTGTFAAQMAVHGITILSTEANFEKGALGAVGGIPFFEVMASRGVVPLVVPTKVQYSLFTAVPLFRTIHNSTVVQYCSLLYLLLGTVYQT